ncbi:MAG: hypothetical protein HQL41_02920 [Alphaproteobacteria bacterium]|nr:hypothetical protein [Alphaproteobacteria bacterium]
MAAYGGIDIALDPFPYSGGVTTLEALWMGVPVITCPGAGFASRHAASHLANAHHPELVTPDFAEYEALAIELAADLARLAGLRACLRSDLRRSRLLDHVNFTRGLEAAFEDMVAA